MMVPAGYRLDMYIYIYISYGEVRKKTGMQLPLSGHLLFPPHFGEEESQDLLKNSEGPNVSLQDAHRPFSPPGASSAYSPRIGRSGIDDQNGGNDGDPKDEAGALQERLCFDEHLFVKLV